MAAGERGGTIAVDYIMDTTQIIEIRIPAYLQDNLSELGLGVASGDGTPRPTGLELRRIFFEYDLSIAGKSKVFKRALPCNIDGSNYITDRTQEMTVDGRTGRTTGRKGERRTFR